MCQLPSLSSLLSFPAMFVAASVAMFVAASAAMFVAASVAMFVAAPVAMFALFQQLSDHPGASYSTFWLQQVF